MPQNTISRRRSRLSHTRSSASFTSGITRLEHIDPVVARRDAYRAANICYAVNNDRNNLDVQRLSWDGHGLPRDENDMHRPREYDLRRQHSIRFVNERPGSRFYAPTPLLLRQQASFDQGVSYRQQASNAAGSRPPSHASSHHGQPPVSDYTRDYVLSMSLAKLRRQSQLECAPKTPRPTNLRKSQSMIVSSSRLGHYFNSCRPARQDGRAFGSSSMARRAHDRSDTATETGSSHFGAESRSFLRSRQLPTGNVQTGSEVTARQQYSDLAVQLARERYFEQIQQQKENSSKAFEYPSLAKKSQRSSQGFRKSLRNISNSSMVASIGVSSTQEASIPKDATLKNTARKVSNSLKNKLKRLFTRKNDQTLETVQGGSASLTDDVVTHEAQDSGMDAPSLSNNNISVISGASRMPLLHTAYSNQQLRSCKGSLESIRSEVDKTSDDKSRVTSWSSSGIATVNSEKTCQRLSIIKEAPYHPGTTYSESVYSSDNKLLSPLQKAEANGHAIYTGILLPPDSSSAVVRNYTPSLPNIAGVQTIKRVVSSASSLEWKAQLAAQVSKLETPRSSSGAKSGSTKFSKHVREIAEIEEGEPLLSSAKSSTHSVELADLADRSLTTSQKQRAQQVFKPEFGSVRQTPTIPNRSSLRPMVSANNMLASKERHDLVMGNPPMMKTIDSSFSHGNNNASKENKAPRVMSRSVSPVKLVRKDRFRQGTMSASITPLNAGYQTTGFGSPMARTVKAAAYPHLSQIKSEAKVQETSDKEYHDAKGDGMGAHITQDRMVDLFLSSRRRRIAGSDETGAFV